MQRADCTCVIIVVATALGVWRSGTVVLYSAWSSKMAGAWFMPSSCCYLFMYAPIAYAPAKLGRSSSDKESLKKSAFCAPEAEAPGYLQRLRRRPEGRHYPNIELVRSFLSGSAASAGVRAQVSAASGPTSWAPVASLPIPTRYGSHDAWRTPKA